MRIDLPSPEATRAFGRRLGEACRGGEVLLLCGPLGAGKTCFVQGLALGLGVPEDAPVTSPTFVLHTRHPGRRDLEHIDLYRLLGLGDGDPDAAGRIALLGFDELWGDPAAVCAVEWADLLGPAAPRGALTLQLEIAGPEARRLTATASDPRHEALARQVFACGNPAP